MVSDFWASAASVQALVHIQAYPAHPLSPHHVSTPNQSSKSRIHNQTIYYFIISEPKRNSNNTTTNKIK
jgi:hypothetical protein